MCLASFFKLPQKSLHRFLFISIVDMPEKEYDSKGIGGVTLS